MSLLQSEAWAYAGKNDLATAEKILRQAQAQFPQEFMPFAILVDLYLSKSRPADGLAVLENQLKFQPRNVSALINVAVLKMQLEDYAAALPSLNRALELDPQNPYGLINRAIANLQAGKLDAALLDYELLERALPKPSHVVAYGLAEIARQKKERKKALEYYESYLKRAPAGAPEIPLVHERIKKLKNGSF
jgi:tetratricopeptide (TPR) repeat protein